MKRIFCNFISMETTTKPTIKASDLRIGNYVQPKDVNLGYGFKTMRRNPTKVLEVRENTIVSFKNDFVCQEEKLDELEPILLTLEILVKCGFEPFPFDADENHEEYFRLRVDKMDGQIVYYQYKNEFYVSAHHSPDFYGVEVKLKYLHELQNLFFILSGNELDIVF